MCRPSRRFQIRHRRFPISAHIAMAKKGAAAAASRAAAKSAKKEKAAKKVERKNQKEKKKRSSENFDTDSDNDLEGILDKVWSFLGHI